jgi:hypothetical protein
MLRCFLGSVQRKKSVREKKVLCPCVFVWACVTDLNLREGVARPQSQTWVTGEKSKRGTLIGPTHSDTRQRKMWDMGPISFFFT